MKTCYCYFCPSWVILSTKIITTNYVVSQFNSTTLLKVPYAQHACKCIYDFYTNSTVLCQFNPSLISSPLTLLSSGPPDQRKQIRRWQSCHGNGSSWWHPASPPQWWKWYSLAHSGQAVAGIPYIGEQGRRRRMEKEKERESGLRSSLNCLCGSTSHPPLSATSPSLHLSSSPLFSPLLISVSKECMQRGRGWNMWVGGVGWGIFMTVEKTGWRRMLALQMVRRDSVFTEQMLDLVSNGGKISLFLLEEELSRSWSDKQWTQWNKHCQKKKKKNPTWN